MSERDFNPIELFSMYMQLTGVPTLESEPGNDPALRGKTLGIVNGASWISLWSTYFARQMLPGVKLVNVGNEGVQLNFMGAHQRGEPCPPQINIDLFVQYAEDLVKLYPIDAVIITCSTMNRAAGAGKAAMAKHRIPVVQIDEPMMEAAVTHGGKILVVATHGPTVKNTQQLLRETAEKLGTEVSFAGATIEDAFHYLGNGDIQAHNEAIAGAIREAAGKERIDLAVLAQLSMSVFKFSYPDCETTFGFPVLTSGECGFARVKEILTENA
jgi:hypothetical protein